MTRSVRTILRVCVRENCIMEKLPVARSGRAAGRRSSRTDAASIGRAALLSKTLVTLHRKNDALNMGAARENRTLDARTTTWSFTIKL